MVAYHTHTLPTATKEEAAAGLRDDIALSPASLNGVTIPIVPAPADWNTITGKPDTFPPTLPIPSSGVMNLDVKQAAQDEAIDGKEPLLPPGAPDQFWRGDKTWATGPVGPAGPASTVPGPQGPKGDTGGQVMYIGINPPASPVVGQTWWESDSGNSFVYYDDGNSVQWVPTHVGALPPSGGGGVTDGDKGDIVVSGSGTAWMLDVDRVKGSVRLTVSATAPSSPAVNDVWIDIS